MSLTINTNISALNSSRQLSATESGLSQALKRLSTGIRINSAADDSAGLAISERMTTQVRGLNQAARNANDGVSMLQTAEGALSSVAESLQRVRELAIQASNATNSASDKAALQAEASQLVQSIDGVGKTTAFNGELVFESSSDSTVGDPDKLAVIFGLQAGWLEQAETMIRDYYGIIGDGAEITIDLTTFTDGAGNVAARVTGAVPGSYTGKATDVTLEIDMADFVPSNLPNGGTEPFYNDRIITHEMVHAVMYRSMNIGSMSNPANDQTWFLEGAAEFIHGADERLESSIASVGVAGVMTRAATFSSGGGSWGSGTHDYSAAYAAVRYLHQTVKNEGGEGIKDVMTYLTQNQSATLDDAINAATNGTFATADAFITDFNANGTAFISAMNLTNDDTGAVGGLDADGGAIKTAESVNLDVGMRYGEDPLIGFTESWEKVALDPAAGKIKTLQVGFEARQTLDVALGPMNAVALNINSIDLVETPGFAIAQVDTALAYINGQRAKLGAQMNRLESVITNLQTGAENISASRSRIKDADYAAETTSLVKSQILQQAAMAMTAQAQSMPQMVLALLR